MYINFRNDRKDLDFMCLKDKKAGDQVTIILVIGFFSIKIYVNSFGFVNDQDLVDRSYLTSPSCERVIKTGSGILIGNQQISEGLKFTLTTRSGDLGKSGPGARAKADARKNFNKRSGSSILPGASGYIQQAYRLYHESDRGQASPTRGQASPTILEGATPNFNDGLAPRIAPSVTPNRQSRIQSEPLKIKSKHQKTDVMITKKDIRNWITQDQRKETSNQKINEKRVEDEYADIVKTPNEVLNGIHIHREQKNCKVYIKDIKSTDSKLALIADTETGRAYLGSILTKEEYSNLKKTGEIDLFDFRRDPQTLVMNPKGIQEADSLSRAIDQGHLTEFTNIRRPYNVSESLKDYVGKDSTGSKIEIDMKGIDRSGHRPLNRQTQDINKGIKDAFDGVKDPTKLQIICDISPVPTFLQETVIKNITQGFNSIQLENINFLF